MAITSGTLVIGLLLDELTFNIVALRLGGTCIMNMPIRLHQGAPRYSIRKHGYTVKDLLPFVGVSEGKSRGWWASEPH